jgi:hypothetical protein
MCDILPCHLGAGIGADLGLSRSRPGALRACAGYPASWPLRCPRICHIEGSRRRHRRFVLPIYTIYAITQIVGATLAVYRLALIVDPHAE